MTRVFLSLGSNIDPEKNTLQAVKILADHVQLIKSSTVLLTEPLEGKVQPRYYNCVVEVETELDPARLKNEVLRPIEQKLGRKREKDKYASRTIDIDLELYGDLCLSAQDLIIPDPKIREQYFLSVSICELEPDLIMPDNGEKICDIAANFKHVKMEPLGDFSERLSNLIHGLRV